MQVARVKNNFCTGEQLILHPAEPDDDLSLPYRTLRFPPLAILVRPEHSNIKEQMSGIKPGCIPILPKSKTFSVTLPDAPTDGPQTYSVKRTSHPVGDGYAVTDYFVQGTSFKQERWLLHMNPPSRGFSRATLLVMLTRYRSLDDIFLVCPLWPAVDMQAREAVITKFHEAVRVDSDLLAEMKRLVQVDAATRAKYAHLLEQAC